MAKRNIVSTTLSALADTVTVASAVTGAVVTEGGKLIVNTTKQADKIPSILGGTLDVVDISVTFAKDALVHETELAKLGRNAEVTEAKADAKVLEAKAKAKVSYVEKYIETEAFKSAVEAELHEEFFGGTKNVFDL